MNAARRPLGLIAIVALPLTSGCLFGDIRDEPEIYEEMDTSGGTDTSSSADATGDTGTGTDTGGSTDPEVECATETCVGGDICCVTMTSTACRAQCESNEVGITCDDAADCGGAGVCCWGLIGGSSCQADASACTGSTPTVACADDDDCSGVPGTTCQAESFVPWIFTCR